MADVTRKVVKVFLASPGDLLSERSIAKDIVEEFNETFGRSLGYHIDLVGWEDVTPGFGRPQALINKDVEQCEYFIGLMWKRWGTPPGPAGHEFTSGFEEEFELALRRRSAGPAPEISLFFKDIAREFLVDQGPDLRQVLAFRKRMETEKRILYQAFSDELDLSKKLRRCLFKYIGSLNSQSVSPIAAQQEPNSQATNEVKHSDDAPILKPEGMSFVREFLDRAGSRKAVTPLFVARFRLLGDVASRPNNDLVALGVHDANIIFIQIKTDETLGSDERGSLADCGLKYFPTSQNAPLWRWLASLDAERFFVDQHLRWQRRYASRRPPRNESHRRPALGGREPPDTKVLS